MKTTSSGEENLLFCNYEMGKPYLDAVGIQVFLIVYYCKLFYMSHYDLLLKQFCTMYHMTDLT